ncbi:Leucine-, isoleucine-, valine-, threonine-, and alanine-binding protein precursor [Nocardioides dokdonensis FR1436]|uniref:Leucine-, isoleucine-, valine-, threonine-, and alanine-binding protein n=1 Tax=Nocardioides dokdonensis FR1436 TaxID=1300347 RepID=A0A1A9GEX1_9ACTN|nr:ABC transporter substrate-binding protein [Nocardioides dokdonensis]ANH36889.1 Leucine-, isoleucine-, valine-, threonine-, and alanine-binding protein precursor [Nocardioides dokdonensis FR1436]
MKARLMAPLAGLLTATMVLAGCGAGGDRESDAGDGGGGASDVGVTDDTITLGAHFPLTGVAAPGYSEIPTGAKAYFDYVNAAGGVNGRQIEYIVKDDGYNPTNTSQVTNELVLKDEIFAMVGGLGTPTHSAVVDFLNSEGVPDFFVSSGSLQWGDDVEAKPYTFGWQPDYEIEGKIIGQYVAETMPDAKVGLFLQDDDFGDDGEKGVRQYLDDQIVGVERYTSGNTDVGPQVSGLQAAGADLVLSFNTPSYTALTQLTALSLGYKPTWFYSNVGSDPQLVGSLLNRFSEGAVDGDNSSLNGVLTTEYIPGVDAPDDAWVQLWQKVWDQEGEGGKLTNYRVYGMSQAYAFVQALMATGEDLTRDGLVETLEEQGGDFDGPQLAPFRFSADSHMGISGLRVVELQGGKSEDLTPVLVSDIGDAPIEEDSSDQANDAPPESGIPDAG